MQKINLIINEQHQLLEDQKQVLNKICTEASAELNIIKIPKEGLTLSEITELAYKIQDRTIFISPIPALMKHLTDLKKTWNVFHNDKRSKKELPNGTIISTVAEYGWEIV